MGVSGQCVNNGKAFPCLEQYIIILLLSIHFNAYNSAEETYVLIDWVGEDSSSVVKGTNVIGGSFKVGEVSTVRTGGRNYDGIVVASGKYMYKH